MTGFRPSDWHGDEPALTARLKDAHGFSFESLSKSEHLIEFSGVILISIAGQDLLPILANFVLEYTFTGKIRGLTGPNGDAMVEYGVSRFKKSSTTFEAETDEPLAILGLVKYLEHNSVTLQGYLIASLTTPDPSHRGVVFEAFGAYLLALAFSVPTPLSQIFEFESGKEVYAALQDELAELVALEKDGDKFKVTPFNIKDNFRSSHLYGRSLSSVPETLGWLKNPRGSVFCFPANTVGPDLIFVLRLVNDGTVLRVCFQFKHTKYLSPQAWEKAISTTDPSHFVSRRTNDENSSGSSGTSPMRKMLVKAIQNLGEGTKKAGPCGVLRVIISHPSSPDSNALKEAAKGDHPVATVPLKHLESELDSDLSQTILSLADLSLQTPDLKRRNLDKLEGAGPKKPRREVIGGVGGPPLRRPQWKL